MKLYILLDNNLSVSRIVSQTMAIIMYRAFLEDYCNKLKNAHDISKYAIENLNPGTVYDLSPGEEFGQTVLTCVLVDL